jgi:tRNA1(Val) A37 N6-methylase TrmN6
VSAEILATTEDTFLGGALQVLQPADGYRAGLDAVLLAAAAPLFCDRVQQVLDVGAGAGVVGLAIACRLSTAEVTLLEKETALAELAGANIARNGLTDRVRILNGDATIPLGRQPHLGALAEAFDHVLANPPYQIEGTGTPAATHLKAAAHSMPRADLDSWLRFMAAMTRPGGSATMIHRAESLGPVLTAFSGRFGRLLVFPLFPRAGEPAHRVLVQGIKGSRAPLRLMPGLVLHEAGHGFRPEVDAILRGGSALDLAAHAHERTPQPRQS